MKTIQNWRDLEPYGIDLLTGEACALSYRGLFDLTAEGLELVKRVIGAVEITAPSNWNSKAIASLLMPYTMFEPLAVFALFEREQAQHVFVCLGARAGASHFVMACSAEEFPSVKRELDITCPNYRLLTYPEQRRGVTVGMSNVHQMSGRIA
jgi:hypothetical protein